MRLFAAVRPSRDAIGHLASALDPVAGTVRAVPPERWHVTVCFYGEVPEPSVSRLAGRLARAARRSRPGTLQLAGSGCFGAEVLWIGLQGDTEVLERLADAAGAAGRRENLPIERRRFRPHLTLARGRGQDLRPIAQVLGEYRGPTWSMDRLVLAYSTLGAHPAHAELASWPLGPDGPASALQRR